MTHERMQLVRHWMERASEALDEAQLMAESQHWNACVNRPYYACFYAVTALLLKRRFSASKHTAVRSLFNRHVVKANLVSREQADLYTTCSTIVERATTWPSPSSTSGRYMLGCLGLEN